MFNILYYIIYIKHLNIYYFDDTLIYMSKNNKSSDTANNNNDFDISKMTDEQKDMLAESILLNNQHIRYPLNEKQSALWKYKFWKEQPVKQNKISMINTCIIDNNLTKTENVLLPSLEWFTFDTNSDDDMSKYSDFLSKNYLEDKSGKFCPYYTAKFLKWSLYNGIVIGIRKRDNKKIIGTISGTIKTYRINEKESKLLDINFLCLLKGVRKVGLAEKLITELKNIFLEKNIYTGFFTTERYVPTPFSKVRFYQRPINYYKLYKTNYLQIDDDKQLDTMISKYKIYNKLPSNVVLMTEDNVSQAFDKYNEYMDMYNFYQKYTFDEFKYWFLNDQCLSYVVLNEKNNKVLDFFSFYILKTLKKDIINNTIENYITNAYLSMYTSTTSTVRRILEYFVLSAQDNNCDVVTLTNNMESGDILDEPNGEYMQGTGFLHYNFYNLESPILHNYQIAKVTF